MRQWLGRLGNAQEFWRVFHELNPETIKEEAERPPRLLLAGERGSGKSTLAVALMGGAGRQSHVAGALPEISVAEGEQRSLPTVDLVVYVADAVRGISPLDRDVIAGLRYNGRPHVVLVTKCDQVDNLTGLRYEICSALGNVPLDRIAFVSGCRSGEIETTVARLIWAALPKCRLALARLLAALRPSVAEALIMETARVNAEFALLSNLPANVPLIGGLLGGGADFLVLTKNQSMMIFKLAAIYDRDLQSKMGIVAEVAPVVGAAFLWRTVARELVGMLPTYVAAVPKTAIGYVGTYVVGRMAQYYYVVGSRPPREVVKEFTSEARQQWQRVAAWRPRHWKEWWSAKRQLEQESQSHGQTEAR